MCDTTIYTHFLYFAMNTLAERLEKEVGGRGGLKAQEI